MISQRVLAAMFAVVASAAIGCRAPRPVDAGFPTVDASSDAAVLAVVDARSHPPRTLYAELAMSIDSAEASGVFDAVCLYDVRGRMRFTAFRDAFVSVHDIFDLVLRGDQYELVLHAAHDEGGSADAVRAPRRTSGSVADLDAEHPAFRLFTGLRERLFLPGYRSDDESAGVRRAGDAIFIDTHRENGPDIIWRLAPRTLAVLSGEIDVGDGRTAASVLYLAYREQSGRFLPDRFELVDSASGVSVSGRVRWVEIDPELTDEDFALDFEHESGDDE